ncbi:hypothetical protein [Halorussus marinus]|uniref:hypothetical protein n=1 Tax=Halorussus marinus TaxID=2505976 RepID=UPI001092071F|nr:hypothetical protein [Halorussus marinus]
MVEGLDLDALFAEIDAARPSLDKLHRDQQEAIDRFVQEGFATRREFLLWLQELVWNSMGRLHGNWFAKVARDEVVLSCVITSEKRRHYRQTPVSLDAAATVRRRMAKKFIRPACRAGYRTLRKDAQEYVQEDNRVDVDDVSMFAMRPSLQTLKDRQTVALRKLLDGFNSEDALDRWLHHLDDVTLGELDRIDADLDWRLEMERTARDVLLGDRADHARQREQLAAFYLLPAFSLTPEPMLVRSQEAREESDNQQLEATQI